jgi:tetratricopeptide (TPR) repeat protein
MRDCQTCGYHNPDDVDFCLNCAAALNRVCPACGAPAPAGMRFCGQCGSRLPEAAPRPAQHQSEAPAHPSRSALPDGEWHSAAVLWCELEAAPGSDVEAVFETLGLVLPSLRKLTEAQQGYLVRRPSGLTAVFGAQAVHEDDAVRAVATGLGFLQRLRAPVLRGELPLAARLAVSLGPVVVGQIRSPQQPELIVTGEALQAAQRLAAATPAGRLWVTQPVAEAAQHRYTFHPVPSTEAGQTLWELEGELAQAGSARGLPGRNPQLIGRETLLEAMQAMLPGLDNRQGGLIWIEGEAGIGKSRLMREFGGLAAADGLMVWQAACTAQRAGQSFSLMADLLWRLFDLKSADTPEQHQARMSRVLAGWPDEAAAARPYLELLVGISPAGERLAELEPDQRRQQIHVALRSVLKSLAADKPLVLLLDDLHWIDPLSTDLMLFLTNLIAEAPILFVGARRWDEADSTDERLIKVQSMLRPAQVLRLHLDRLSEAEADQLLGQLLADDSLPLEVRQFVLRRSEGNPFYIEEVARTLIEQNYLRQRDGRWQLDLTANLQALPLPTTLGALIQSRVDTLPPELRHLLQCAAVLGGTFESALLAAVAETPDAPTALTRLEARGMLRRTPKAHEWTFNHTLIETSVYNSLLKLRKRALHLKAAAALEQRWGRAATAHAAELAYHFGQANAGDRALPYLAAAGEQAASRYANEEALAYFQQAADQLTRLQPPAAIDTDLRWRVAVGLGDVYRFVGQYAESQAALEAGLALRDSSELPPVAEAGLHRRLGETAQKLGEYEASLHYFERALACLRPTGVAASEEAESTAEEAAEAARALVRTAVTHLRQGRAEQGREACEAGAAEARQAGSLGDLAAAENLLGGIYYQLSDWEKASVHTRKAMALSAELGHTWGVAATASNLGILACLAGDWEQAQVYFERSLKMREEMGDVEGIAIAHGNLGDLTRDQGDLAQAEVHYRSSLEMATPLKMAHHLASASSSLAGIWLQQEKLKAAEAMLASARAQAEALGARELVCENHRLQADWLLARGQIDEARTAIRSAAAVAAEIGDRRQEAAAWCTLSEIELREGQVEPALAAISQAWRVLEGVTSQLDLGRVSLQAGKVSQAAGARAEAAAHFDRAMELFQRLGAQRDLAEARAAQEALRQQGPTTAASGSGENQPGKKRRRGGV